MQTQSLSRCGLSVCVAAILLAGCAERQAGALGPMTPAGQSVFVFPASVLSGETLTSTRLKSHCQAAIDLSAKFHASGNASGPFPGTFTVEGGFGGGGPMGGGYFKEHFKITSGSDVILGFVSKASGSRSCSGGSIGKFVFDGSVPYKTKLPHSKGMSEVDISASSFSETF